MNSSKGECSMRDHMDERWRNIWDLIVPSVTKMFLWKVRINLLPTKENLFKRKVVGERSCPVCNAEIETIMHVLWTYLATNGLWAKAGSRVHKWSRIEDDFIGLWERLMQKLNKSQLEEVAMVLRRVWLCRNIIVFEKKLICPQSRMRTTTEALLEYKNAQTPQFHEKQIQVTAKWLKKWKKLGCDFVKVNWDAFLKVKEKRMGVGIIIRDEKGEPMVAVCDQKKHVEIPVMAECIALSMVLELCSELNIHNAIFEGDAKIVIMAIQREEEKMSCFGSLVEDVKFFFKSNRDWQLQFAYRENDIVAHSLARTALGLLEKTVWIEEMPAFVAKVLDNDKHCSAEIHQ